MYKVILLSTALLGLTAQVALAKSVSSSISIETYKSRCLAAGGTVTNVSAGGVKCRLPSGATVTCYDTDGPGISCDYRVVTDPKVPAIVGSAQTINPGIGTRPPKAGSDRDTATDSEPK